MALNPTLQCLIRLPLLATLEPDALRLLAFSAEHKTLRYGETLFNQGATAEVAYLVMRGQVDLTKTAPDGSATVLSATTGMLINETALLRSTVCGATAVAGEPTHLLTISKALFQRVLAEHPQSARRLRAFVARRLQERLAGVMPEEG